MISNDSSSYTHLSGYDHCAVSLAVAGSKFINDNTITATTSGQYTSAIYVTSEKNGLNPQFVNNKSLTINNTAGIGLELQGDENRQSSLQNSANGVITIANAAGSYGIVAKSGKGDKQYTKIINNGTLHIDNAINAQKVDCVGLVWSRQLENNGMIDGQGSTGYYPEYDSNGHLCSGVLTGTGSKFVPTPFYCYTLRSNIPELMGLTYSYNINGYTYQVSGKSQRRNNYFYLQENQRATVTRSSGTVTGAPVTIQVPANNVLWKVELNYLYNVIVGKAVTGITLNKTSYTLEVGRTFRLTTATQPTDAFVKWVGFDSQDKSIANVWNDNGDQTKAIVSATKPGTTYITVWSVENPSIKTRCMVTVVAPVIKYTLTLNANGGKLGTKTSTTKQVVQGGTFGTLSTPTRTGYTFAGWYTTAKTGGSKIVATSKVNLKGNTTLYARWTAKQYTTTFNGNSGKIGTKKSSTKSVTYGAAFGTLPSPKRAGYTFSGWYTAKTGGSKITATTKVSITANKTYYARWTKVTVAKTKITKLQNKSGKKAYVAYKKIGGVKGYVIQYSTDKKFKKNVKTISTTGTAKTIAKLSKKKTYYIRVRAYKVDSTGKKIYGSYCTVKSVKIKK